MNKDSNCNLKLQIHELENNIQTLKNVLLEKEKLLEKLLKLEKSTSNLPNFCQYTKCLSTNEICRYSRQMLVPEIGLASQTDLKKSSVLVVGIGGLGCPASLYLAAAGVGTITLLDYDIVEISNLHRQILHCEATVGIPKVKSASINLESINSGVKIIPLCVTADSETLKNLFAENKYDVVIDGSDNVVTRYLLNDICVMNKTPLVSGSALKMEGQLTVYNYKEGPCYRCLFPVPPPPESVTNCGDGGVLGAVPGTIGVLQALEAIKIITGMDGVLSGRLLVFDGASTSFMNVKLRNKNRDCHVCGSDPKITELINYEQFCSSKAHDKVIDINILSKDENISVEEFSKLNEDSVIIDVRPKIEYEMCKLPNTINIPYTHLTNSKNLDEFITFLNSYKSQTSKVYFICRRGNDSQRTVQFLKNVDVDKDLKFINVQGGLHSYAKHIDSSFPLY